MRWVPVFLVLLGVAPGGAAQTAPAGEGAEGFVPLFNGKDLGGWKIYQGRPEGWAVRDGLLVCTGKGGGWLGTRRDYANFVLRLEYRLRPHGNSGVYLRAPEEGHISRVGMEVQILDDDHPGYARLKPWQYAGSLYGVVPPARRACKPAGQWNALEVQARGRRLVVVLNGQTVVDADLDVPLKDPAVAREHPGLARSTGRLGLQSHSEPVEFRNVRVKELP